MAKKIVIIVEDDIYIHDLLLDVFKFEGYITFGAKNGAEALRISKEAEPDIVVLDYQLPDMNGVEVCMSMKSDPITSKTKILMISGMSQSDDIREAYEAKVDAYMTKPFGIKQLVGKVEELLQGD